MSSALTHFLEHAAALHLPRFGAWFPTTFDWERLCADLPDVARRTQRTLPGHPGAELERMGGAVFQAGHLLTLAVLCARASEEADPEELIERLTSSPDEDEEESFRELVAGHLDLVEERLGGAEGEAAAIEGEDGGAQDVVARAVVLVGASWSAVEDALDRDEERVFERAGPAAGLLWNVAVVAAILGAFRWMAAERHADGWPLLGLD